jgi:hypothetical protein
MGNPVMGALKRLAKWLVKKGQEELEKEVDERRGKRADPDRQPPFPR